MNQSMFDEFVAKIIATDLVFAPKSGKNEVFVDKIKNAEQINWSGKMPRNSFKSVFLPARDTLFALRKKTFAPVFESETRMIALAMNVLDLQALTLLEHIFEKDIYFQKRRARIVAIGYTGGLEADLRRFHAAHLSYEENILEHILFDVFIERQKNNNWLFYSGSEKGQKFLEGKGVADYENIEFAGLVPEAGINPLILQNRKAVENSAGHKLWKELAEICLACGKCSVVCPTCFCFDEDDEVENGEKIKKIRNWSSCFYPEFTKVAGGGKDLTSLADKIYFWYFHKFVRIPEELSYYGCVGCGRCIKTCPVGIDLPKNLQRLSPFQGSVPQNARRSASI